MSPSIPHRLIFSPGAKKDIFIVILLFAAFFCGYFALSLCLANTGVFSADDVLFEIDAHRAIIDIAQFNAMHFRTTVHPLFELLVNPSAELLLRVTGSPVTAAVAMNSLAGAAGVALAYLFFRLTGAGRGKALLFTAFFGVSSGQLFHAAIPDTSAFATVALVITYILFAHTLYRGRLSHPLWIAAGIATLGTTTTNFAQTFLCYGVAILALEGARKWKNLLNRLVFFTLSVVSITAALSIVQKFLYPLSNPFFMPYAYSDEAKYASLLILNYPLQIVQQLTRDFLLVDFIVPFPLMYWLSGRLLPTVSVENSNVFGPAGMAAAVLWATVCAMAAWGLWRGRSGPLPAEKRHLAAGFLLCLLFNVCLHTVYGAVGPGDIHYFLFSGNFAFLVLALAALPVSKLTGMWKLLVPALVILTLVNNLQVFFFVVGIYSG